MTGSASAPGRGLIRETGQRGELQRERAALDPDAPADTGWQLHTVPDRPEVTFTALP